MVSNLQHYPYVTITNRTPYATQSKPGVYSGLFVLYEGLFCKSDSIDAVIASGDTWTASSRGVCLVTLISANMALPDGSRLACAPYKSTGTSNSIYSVWLKGDDTCVVRSSHETG